MLKVKYKYLLFSVVFSTISVLPNSCSLFKKQKEELSEAELKSLKKITIIACGTAYHAGLVAKYAIEKWAKIHV